MDKISNKKIQKTNSKTQLTRREFNLKKMLNIAIVVVVYGVLFFIIIHVDNIIILKSHAKRSIFRTRQGKAHNWA